jgi:chromosome segregation ATPase
VSDKIRIVFDGPPGHESGRFVDVEDTNGRSIKIGEWVELPLGRAPFYALEIDDPRTLAQLRSDLARVTQERDEALREVQRKGAREIGLLSRALAAETQSDITQDALTAMRQERDALSAQLTTAVRDARATAAGDIQRAESERDAALSDLAKMTEALAIEAEASRGYAEQRDAFKADRAEWKQAFTAMRHRAERAEAELAEALAKLAEVKP